MLHERYINDGKAELVLNDFQIEMRDQVRDKMHKQMYPLEEVVCAVCGSSASKELARKDRYGLPHQTVACVNCGLVYSTPRMTEFAYNEFYNVEYRKLYIGKEAVDSTYFNARIYRGERIHNYLKEKGHINNEKLRVLEVGCSAGSILKFFADEGHEVTGIDLGEEYVQFGKRQHGLDLRIGTIDTLKDEELFDVIIYSDVLEHILNLGAELQKLRELCTDETIVYIQVPGVKNLVHTYEWNFLRYLQNAHTYHFSLTSLVNLMKVNGFELASGDERVFAVFKKTEKSTDIVNDYDSVLRYLERCEKFRFFYGFSEVAIRSLAGKIRKRISEKMTTFVSDL